MNGVPLNPPRTITAIRSLRNRVGVVSLAVLTLAGSTVATSALGASATTQALTVIPESLTAITPARLVDTRPGGKISDDGANPTGIRESGTVLRVPVAGRNGVPTEADAAFINITSPAPKSTGFVTAYPCDVARPNASNVNLLPGETVANGALVPLDGIGDVCLFVMGRTDLVVDVTGYTVARAQATNGGTLTSALRPHRLVDTRPGNPIGDDGANPKGRRTSGQTLKVQVVGRGGVPSQASAALLNLTATGASRPGYLTAYDCGSARPTASNLNLLVGRTVANTALVKLDDTGSACIYSEGDTDVVIDLAGFVIDAAATSYTADQLAVATTSAVPPTRLIDTRPGYSIGVSGADPKGTLTQGSVLQVKVTGRADVPTVATGVYMNLTSPQAETVGYVTAYPCDAERPLASNLNLLVGRTIATNAYVDVDADGNVCFYSAGTTHLVVDVTGYTTDPSTVILPPTSSTTTSTTAAPTTTSTTTTTAPATTTSTTTTTAPATTTSTTTTTTPPTTTSTTTTTTTAPATTTSTTTTTAPPTTTTTTAPPTTTTTTAPPTTTTTSTTTTTAPPTTTSSTTTTAPPTTTSSTTTTTTAPAAAPCADLGSDPLPFTEAMEPLDGDPTGPLLYHLDCWVNRPRDNMITLLPGGSRHSGVVQRVIEHAKYFNVREWDATTDEFVWTVDVSEPTTFDVQLNMTSGPGDAFLLDVVGTSNQLAFGPSNITSYDLLEPGSITIPAGRHELRLRKTASATNSNIIALQLIRSADFAAYQQRVNDFRTDTSWLRGKRGFMTQWGSWSYPRTGPDTTDQEAWNSFDVELFVNEMVKAKVDFVAWSVSWIQYRFPAPIAAVDQISDDDRTAERDLLMEVAEGLKAEGIDLVIYYHVGHSLRADNGNWWANQDFPNDTYKYNGYGDRSTFFNNWKAIMTEVGDRYGDLIKGYFFDDGIAYFGADFEALGDAARTGYPDRFISYNPWIVGPGTQFQDVYFGEGGCPAKVNYDGLVASGPYEGLLSHCMVRIHNDWGSWIPDDPNPGYTYTPDQYYRKYRTAPDEGAISVAQLMWDGPTFVDTYPDGTAADGNLNSGLSRDIVPNYVRGLEYGRDGYLFATAADNRVYWTYGDGWQALLSAADGGFSAERYGSIYLLRNGDLIKQAPGTTAINLGNNGYSIATISVGADGSIFGLTTTGELIRWTSGSWRPQNTGLTGIKALNTGASAADVWLLDSTGVPYHFTGSSAQPVSSGTLRFTAIEAATNGDVFAIGTDQRLYQYSAGFWSLRAEVGRVLDVAARSHGDFWFIDADTHWLGHVDGTSVIKAHRSSIS